MKKIIFDEEIIHGWFGLSYASYLVLPRSILQSAPVEWQKKFVDCLEELGEMFGCVPKDGTYEVQLRNDDGRYMHDVFQDYERGRRRIVPNAKR